MLVRTQEEGNVSSYSYVGKIHYFSNDSASDVILESTLVLFTVEQCYDTFSNINLYIKPEKKN